MTSPVWRVLAKVVEDDETTCWVFCGSRSNGYGRVAGPGSRPLRAHRVTYQHFRGPIPDGLDLDHLCRNRACVNPDHLEPVTRAENLRRAEGMGTVNACKTHCPKGHPYDEANTYRNPTTGKRSCRPCANASHRRARAA